MRKTALVGTAAAVTLVVSGVAVQQAQAGSSPAPHATTSASSHGVVAFTVVERAKTDTVADTGVAGDSLGDVLAFANPIFSADNKTRIGSDNGSCIRTAVGKAWECSWTLTLARGSLVVQGPFYDAKDSDLAITGGTGVWASARGQMHLHARDTAGTAYDFTYRVLR
jgi:allene oxide cyclase